MTYPSDPGRVPTESAAEAAGSFSSGEPAAAPRYGRPRPDGKLRSARRAVARARLLLVVIALICASRAAATAVVDVRASDAWTVGMAVAICLLPAGGLVWWVEHPLSPPAASRERARRIGRQVRAALATLGLAGVFVGVFTDLTGMAVSGLLIAVASPLAYLIAMLGRPSDEQIAIMARAATATPGTVGHSGAVAHARPGNEDTRTEPRRAAALRAVAEHRETLVSPADDRYGGRRRQASTIRPRGPVGPSAPRRFRRWLENGSLSSDGRLITVTDRYGHTHQHPLADDQHPNGVVGLMVRRQTVRIATTRGWSAPQYREHLSLLDALGRRVSDLEIYGWTRTDLIAFARAGGLWLEVFEPPSVEYVPSSWNGTAHAAFDLAFPRAHGYRKVPGGVRTGQVLLATGASVALLACLVIIGLVGVGAGNVLPAPAPWPTIISMVLILGLSFGSIAAVMTFFNRANARWHSPPGPPDAI